MPDAGRMFDAYCPDHGGPVLLTARRILRIDARLDRLVISLRCWCGAVACSEVPRRIAVPA